MMMKVVFVASIAMIFALLLFSHSKIQYDQIRSALVHHTGSVRDLAREKIHYSASEMKKAYSNIKEKILSKVGKKSTEKPVARLEEEEIEMNSSTLNEFLRRFAEEMAKHQKKMQEASPADAPEQDEAEDGITEVAEVSNEKQAVL